MTDGHGISSEIRLKPFIDKQDYQRIRQLAEVCESADRIRLKLELEYKLADAGVRIPVTGPLPIREFMFFQGEQLVGYLGVCSFGGRAWEVSGMVHPDWRRQGIFSSLFRHFLTEREHQQPDETLLLCDGKSATGRAFVAKTGAIPEHAEHEMFLQEEPASGPIDATVKLRKAIHGDIAEIARQNRIYFDMGPTADDSSGIIPTEGGPGLMDPEEEQRRGMTIYLAERDHQPVGKVHIQRGSDACGIYGLGVLPQYRQQGIGRTILSQAVAIMKAQGAPAILLQVDADNETALGLYLSCGFRETSVMNYYRLGSF